MKTENQLFKELEKEIANLSEEEIKRYEKLFNQKQGDKKVIIKKLNNGKNISFKILKNKNNEYIIKYKAKWFWHRLYDCFPSSVDQCRDIINNHIKLLNHNINKNSWEEVEIED